MQSESDKWGWKHVSVFGGFDKGSGTKRWKCNHCNLRYNGSYSRVRAHLLGFTGVGVKSCPAIDRSMREAFQILEEERLARKKKRTSGSGKPGKRIRTSQLSLNHIWKSISKEDVDDVVARFFYAEGLNIHVANSPYFYELINTVASFGPGYESPSVDKLSGSFLIKEKARIEKSLASVRESWPQTGCTILCVNCLDCTRGCSCINMFVSSPRGLMFFKAVRVNDGDTLENVFTGAISDAIMEVGSTNVLQIILNLGHGSESFESLMMPKFPHIFWSPCTSHSIRQLMENIAELDWIKPIVLCAKGIEQCMLTFQRSSPNVFTQDLKQSSDPLSAKFAPSYYLVHRIFEIKQALQEVVVSEEWKEWKLMTLSEDNISIEASILGDNFWSGTHLFLQLCEPFVRLLATFNIDKSVMGDVFDWRMRALEAIRRKGIDDDALNQVEVLLESRWDMYFSPLHAAGYILNPRYFGNNQAKDKTAMRGWKSTLERYESDSGARRVLREQLSSYWRVEGSLGDEDAVDCRDKMDPVAWWENFGFETPHLQTLAVKILCQVSSVGICQVSDIPCQEAANRLKVERVEDLVFVQNNLRLHSQRIGNLNSPYGVKHGMASVMIK